MSSLFSSLPRKKVRADAPDLQSISPHVPRKGLVKQASPASTAQAKAQTASTTTASNTPTSTLTRTKSVQDTPIGRAMAVAAAQAAQAAATQTTDSASPASPRAASSSTQPTPNPHRPIRTSTTIRDYFQPRRSPSAPAPSTSPAAPSSSPSPSLPSQLQPLSPNPAQQQQPEPEPEPIHEESEQEGEALDQPLLLPEEEEVEEEDGEEGKEEVHLAEADSSELALSCPLFPASSSSPITSPTLNSLPPPHTPPMRGLAAAASSSSSSFSPPLSSSSPSTLLPPPALDDESMSDDLGPLAPPLASALAPAATHASPPRSSSIPTGSPSLLSMPPPKFTTPPRPPKRGMTTAESGSGGGMKSRGHSRANSLVGSPFPPQHRRGMSLSSSPIDERYLSRIAPPSPARAAPSTPRSSRKAHTRTFSFGLSSGPGAPPGAVLSAPIHQSPSSRRKSRTTPPSSTPGSPMLSPFTGATSPMPSPTSLRKLQQLSAGLDLADRFIPSRSASNLDDIGAYLLDEEASRMQENLPVPGGVSFIDVHHPSANPTGADSSNSTPSTPQHFSSAYGMLLRSEILGGKEGCGAGCATSGGGSTMTSPARTTSRPDARIATNSQLVIHRGVTSPIVGQEAATAAAAGGQAATATSAAGASPSTPARPAAASVSSSPSHPPTYRFQSPRHPLSSTDPWSLSGLQPSTHRLLGSLKPSTRVISKLPFKVLDAPNLKDDFYLNLLDWSSNNVVAVALGAAVYLWNGVTSKVSKLCELDESIDSVTSVSWSGKGNHLAVGTRSGVVQLWDVNKTKLVRTLQGHTARVGSMAWNSQVLASGSRDRSIMLHDPRASGVNSTSGGIVSRLQGHKQEVCGLKWSPDEQQLASGGNDNHLLVWQPHSSLSPLHRFTAHTAAVKALAWSPHQHGLLASGGGTADKCIRFWSTLSGQPLSHLDTGSQVCSLLWSKNVNELVSTHGYSLNQICVWQYPSMQQLTTLVGHSMRVLQLAVSPCGQTILTGAGDETLRFWNIFPNQDRQEHAQHAHIRASIRGNRGFLKWIVCLTLSLLLACLPSACLSQILTAPPMAPLSPCPLPLTHSSDDPVAASVSFLLPPPFPLLTPISATTTAHPPPLLLCPPPSSLPTVRPLLVVCMLSLATFTT